jgi:hypothetical protein
VVPDDVARRVQDPVALGREPSDAEDLVAFVQRRSRFGQHRHGSGCDVDDVELAVGECGETVPVR